MSNKKYRKPSKSKNKTISRETLIIAVLIGFMVGYATRSLIGSGFNVGKFVRESQGVYLPEDNVSLETTLVNKVNDNPNDSGSWIQLGNFYFDAGQTENAISAYSRALQIDPDNANVQTDLGVMYRRSGQFPQAISAFDSARNIDPSHEQSAFNKGIVLYYDMENVSEAVKIWEELLIQNPRFEMTDGKPLSAFLKTIQ